MMRCKPMLGTYVEIQVDETQLGLTSRKITHAIDEAFASITLVQSLMGFHDPYSELSIMNQLEPGQSIEIHPWTEKVLKTAQLICQESHGLFDCGVGRQLVNQKLLPLHQINHAPSNQSSILSIQFLGNQVIRLNRAICLDLGGIAKGFAVDEAVRALKLCGIQNGVVNAGGDLRVFGKQSHTVLLRSPRQVNELIQIGSLQEGAIATSSNRTILHPRQGTTPLQGSYSVIAKECIYADALTKVLALSQDAHHPIFQNYGAESLWLPA
ncbi:FAD:protein FMN transferase [Polynucleobacter paneuropaeus]|nr:FAD:protein FMN transferase [Polynucleobacter paneuropaeus]QWD32287.1 FAD:protein FMN transferase [Polynucleobacter paneuropaeus]